MNSYLIPALSTGKYYREEESIKKSRFITSVAHTEGKTEAAAFIQSLRQELPDAGHHCWAMIAGSPNDTSLWGMSDDGEPSGTAGRPMFTVLEHSGVGELTVVVSRYFGGIKLGTGGLARAYGGSTRQTLQNLNTVVKRFYQQIRISADYHHSNLVEHLVSQYEGQILDRQFTDKVAFVLTIPIESVESISEALINRSQGQIIIDISD